MPRAVVADRDSVATALVLRVEPNHVRHAATVDLHRRAVDACQIVFLLVIVRIEGLAGFTTPALGLLGVFSSSAPENKPPAGMPARVKPS